MKNNFVKMLDKLIESTMKKGASVVFMSKGHKYNEKEATVIDIGPSGNATIQFSNGIQITEVKLSNLRQIANKGYL